MTLRLTDESLYEILRRAESAHKRGRDDVAVKINTVLALALECIESRKRLRPLSWRVRLRRFFL